MDERLDFEAIRSRQVRALEFLDENPDNDEPGFHHGGHRAAYTLVSQNVPALLAEISNLGTALEAAKSDVASLREKLAWEAEKYAARLRFGDEQHDYIEDLTAERNAAGAERDRLAAQVARLEALIENADAFDVTPAEFLRAQGGEP